MPLFPVVNLPKHIEKKLEGLEDLRVRVLENGDFAVYSDSDPDTVLCTVSKADVDKAAKRIGLPDAPKKRTLY
jgi:hypothetical protein